MDCHLGNLTTSCFPVMCVEKCLVASRLCPGISRCTQVRQSLLGGCYSTREFRGVCFREEQDGRDRSVWAIPGSPGAEPSTGTGHNVRAALGRYHFISLQPTWNLSLQIQVCPGSNTPDCRHQLVTKLDNGVLKRRHSLFLDGLWGFLDKNIIHLMNFLNVTEQQKIWPWCFRFVKLKGLNNSFIFALIIQFWEEQGLFNNISTFLKPISFKSAETNRVFIWKMHSVSLLRCTAQNNTQKQEFPM